jgi:hypothetical protein
LNIQKEEGLTEEDERELEEFMKQKKQTTVKRLHDENVRIQIHSSPFILF